VKRQSDAAGSDGVAEGVVEAGDDGVAGDDAPDADPVSAPLEHPVPSRATTRAAAPRDPQSFGTAFHHLERLRDVPTLWES